MRHFITLLALVLAMPPLLVCAADKDKSFEGALTVTETRGGVAMQFLYSRKGDKLRIEHGDKSKPEAVNIVDLAAKKLTIVYPHNSTFVVVDLTKIPAPSGAPNLPPGFPPLSNVVQLQAGAPTVPSFPPPPTPGPAISPPPGFPTPPPIPSMPPMPQMPNNPMASGAAHMPMPPPQGFGAPGMPPMPGTGGFGAAPELKKTDKTRKIQGFDCTLYTLSDHGETFEIWATPDAALFPFRLVQSNYRSRHFGPVMLEERWIELLRNQSLFPLEATLRTDLSAAPAGPPRGGQQNSVPEADHSQERYSFKVDKIEKKKIDNPEELFSPPKDYYEIPGRY
jgi:hypothetical protein